MSLLAKFLGGGRSKNYAEGLALLEEGKFSEAVDKLRLAAQDKSETASGSLASFYFRQALIAEGRLFLRTRRFAEACTSLAEACQLWESYPDLHCLHGTAQGMQDQWSEALGEARFALRINVDYTEARLLEVLALQKLERNREAADSLNALLESGRRVAHWVIDAVQSEDQYTEHNLPDNLADLLLQSLSGRSEKEEVAEAVAICRGGDWVLGLEKFAALVLKRPRYPDYRTRLAAALFQVGRLDEALHEVEAALALNESYRTAIDLKGLILADTGRLRDADLFLTETDAELSPTQEGSSHEELFGAYLRATLALLNGKPERVPPILEAWPDLGHNFARAELLLAAAEYLQGKPGSSGRRLAALAGEWVAEPLYFFLLACHHLEKQSYGDVLEVLSRWPASSEPDLRPIYLENCTSLCEGREPGLPAEAKRREQDKVPPAAWDFVLARAHYLAGRDLECWQACEDLMGKGHTSERILRLQLAAAVNLPWEAKDGWVPAAVVPDSCLAGAFWQAVRSGSREEVERLLGGPYAPHPENLGGRWLTPGFWLEPIRGWIA